VQNEGKSSTRSNKDCAPYYKHPPRVEGFRGDPTQVTGSRAVIVSASTNAVGVPQATSAAAISHKRHSPVIPRTRASPVRLHSQLRRLKAFMVGA
jgi:hypothetical protein